MTIGLLLVLFLPTPATQLDVAWRLAVCGLGFGFFQSPNNRLLIGSAPPDRAGAGSGMLSTSRLVGQTTGSALVALVFGLTHDAAGSVALATQVSIGMAAGSAGLAMVLSTLRLAQPRGGRGLVAKRVIFSADDFGLSEGVNEAVEQRASRRCILDAASLMVAGPAAADAVRRARALPGLRVGLHLVVIEGPSVLPHGTNSRSGRCGRRVSVRSASARGELLLSPARATPACGGDPARSSRRLPRPA